MKILVIENSFELFFSYSYCVNYKFYVCAVIRKWGWEYNVAALSPVLLLIEVIL